MLNLEQLTEKSLQANFTEVQQRHFDRLMSELEVISGGLGFAELKAKAEAGSKEALQVMRDYIVKKEQIVEFIENKEIPPVFVKTIESITPEGVEVKIQLQMELESWKGAYALAGIDWVEFPDKLEVTQEQATRMQELIAKYGFDKMMIIPDEINGNNEFSDNKNYELTNLLLDGVDKISTTNAYRGSGGSISRVRDNRQGLRIVLMKKVSDFNESQLYRSTLAVRCDQVQKTEPFKEPEISGLTLSEFAVWQWMYYKATSKFWGSDGGTGVWLPETKFASDRYITPIALMKETGQKIAFTERAPDESYPNAGTLFGAVFPIE